MAYSTGSAPSCAGVLQALATFCASYGWTVNNNAAYSGGVWWLAINKGSVYINFAVPTGDGLIYVYGATGFSSGSAPSAQPGTSPAVICNPGQTQTGVNPGPYSAYHFFSSTAGTYLHALIEISTGVFAQFHVGQLNTVGGATPAIYISASNWSRYNNGVDTLASNPDAPGNCKPFCIDYAQNNPSPQSGTYVGCIIDSTFRWFASFNGTSPARLQWIGNGGYNTAGWDRNAHVRSPNTFNGVVALIPIPIFAERAVGNIYSLIGEVPDIRFFNMKNNNAKDEITLGSDVWKVYPIITNNPTISVNGGAVSSYPYGMAFKKSA